MATLRLILFSILALLGWFQTVYSQFFDERFDDWPIHLKINGTIVVGESIAPAQLRSWVKSQNPTSLIVLTSRSDPNHEKWADASGVPLEHIKVVTSENIHQAIAEKGTLVIWDEDRPHSTIEADEWTRLKNVLETLVQGGHTVAAFGSHARWLSRFYVDSVARSIPTIAQGMNLLPDCVLECACNTQNVGTAQLLSVLAVHPRCVGIGLESGNILVHRGRKMHLVGQGRAQFLIAANHRFPTRIHEITDQKSRARNPEEFLLDLTEWRRDAIDRTLEIFPPQKIESPMVENGTLFIVGGGGMPEGLMSQFVEAAGGIERARLVYVPCEESEQINETQSMVSTWKRMGVNNACFIHTKDRIQANSDPRFLEPLKDATGIWFGGGRQWNLADSYYGTQAHRLMKEVLTRGGAIGGSSAGASIQASYLARATPIENFKIMAPGYERGGLGFIRGVAIDQHFTQRKRQPDMTQLVNRYPQLLGIGIDESTAIVVQKSTARVFGKGKVHFYDRTKPVFPDRPDHIAIETGQAFELIKREVIPEAEQ